ncbi:MAG: magnesium transporter [Chromatiales bacterium]|jgi:magnesium transporter|nr:magnesium transporter [Chromatiales bacterium]MDX9767340.1 magnesium transporter [Ectothiorhodospiraceae bacterium]
MTETIEERKSEERKSVGIGGLLVLVDQAALEGWLAALAPQDVAAAIETLDDEAGAILLRRLPEKLAPEVFSHLDTEHQARLLNQFAPEEKARLVGELSYDDAAALIDELPDEHTDEIIELLEPGDRQVIESLLSYPEESVGRLMTPEYLAVRPDWTVARALNYVRTHSEHGETANVVFVTDGTGHLLGSVDLRDLLLARSWRNVESLIHQEPVSIDVNADREEAAHLIRHYDIEVLPVVNAEGQMLGIVTVDDVFDLVEEESTEDFHRLGAVGPIEQSLLDASPGLLYRKRIGWLVILVFVNLFSGAAIAMYEASIAAVVALVFFLPLVIGSAGNAGSQAAILMVRALATGDVQTKDWFRLWGKEFVVASSLGLVLGAASWLGGVWLGGYEVATAVSLSMLVVVIMGSMVGMILPFLLMRLDFDPATASSPLVTSIADIGGTLVYFSVATAVLSL